MTDAKTSAPEVRASFLVRDRVTGKPKLDRPIREYPEWAQEAFRAAMTEAEIEEFFR
jgi:hypothetical protein